MANKKVSIVILNYNTKTLLKQCLESVLSIKYQVLSIEIIIVDNNSTDRSKEYLKKLVSRNIKVIFNNQNLGFAGGNNVGIRYAIKNGADYVIVLNNDVIVKDDFWTLLVNFLEKNKRVGVVTPKIYFAPGHEFHKNRYRKSELGKVIWSVGGLIDWRNIIASNRGVDEVDGGQYDQEAEVDFASGCCLAAPAAVWQKVGFFDEKYFMYYEDADFCQKVKKLGYKIMYLPKSRIWHLNAGSSKVGGTLHDYFISRNRLLFGMRWASWRARFALIRESVRVFFAGRPWQKIGVRDFYLKRFGKGSWR